MNNAISGDSYPPPIALLMVGLGVHSPDRDTARIVRAAGGTQGWRSLELGQLMVLENAMS